MKSAPAAAILASILALAACGEGLSTAPEGDSDERIEETIDAFEDALEERDLERVCDRIFSPEGRLRAGGEECPRRLARTLARVRDPDIELLGVTLGRDAAIARVRAGSAGEEPAIDAIRLVVIEGRYHIESVSAR
ncbi:MAG TPA: hypothetical protein VGV57_10875 [Thermoleophilaceae bacterium]|nr:hypothetical protein [Thermoleophilaceae bacterium]